MFQETIREITISVLSCYSTHYLWHVLPCPILISKFPLFWLACICITLFSCIHDFRWIPLSLDYSLSLIYCLGGPLTLYNLQISRIFKYTPSCLASSSAAGPHLPSVAWDYVLSCFVYHVLFCLLCSPCMVEKGWAQGVFSLIMIYFYMLARFVLRTISVLFHFHAWS